MKGARSVSPTSSLAYVYAYVPEEEEEGLFRADAVNEEDPERDRATQVQGILSSLIV